MWFLFSDLSDMYLFLFLILFLFIFLKTGYINKNQIFRYIKIMFIFTHLH